MPIKTLLKDKIIYIAIGVTFLIGFLSLIKIQTTIVKGVTHLDKLEHAFAYFVLTISWLLAIKETTQKVRLKYVVASACLFYGMIIEVLQAILTTYRTASFLDILANFVGIITALLLFESVYKKINAI